ncbi:MAG: site-specific integrase, partial [Armatimonadota bacterium]
MDITRLHEEFLRYVEVERGCSLLTVEAYRADFRRFLCFLAEDKREPALSAIDRQTIRAYVAWQRELGNRNSSIGRRLNSLRSFWKYLRDSEYTERDPFLKVPVPKS